MWSRNKVSKEIRSWWNPTKLLYVWNIIIDYRVIITVTDGCFYLLLPLTFWWPNLWLWLLIIATDDLMELDLLLISVFECCLSQEIMSFILPVLQICRYLIDIFSHWICHCEYKVTFLLFKKTYAHILFDSLQIVTDWQNMFHPYCPISSHVSHKIIQHIALSLLSCGFLGMGLLLLAILQIYLTLSGRL